MRNIRCISLCLALSESTVSSETIYFLILSFHRSLCSDVLFHYLCLLSGLLLPPTITRRTIVPHTLEFLHTLGQAPLHELVNLSSNLELFPLAPDSTPLAVPRSRFLCPSTSDVCLRASLAHASNQSARCSTSSNDFGAHSLTFRAISGSSRAAMK